MSFHFAFLFIVCWFSGAPFFAPHGGKIQLYRFRRSLFCAGVESARFVYFTGRLLCLEVLTLGHFL